MPGADIVDRILALRDREPDRRFGVALKGGVEEAITYDTLVAEASRFANGLADSGVAPGRRVIIILDFAPDCYYAFLGAMLLGAHPVFLPPLTAKQDPGLYYQALPLLMARLAADALVTSAARLAEIRRFAPALPARILEVERRAQFDATLPAICQRNDIAFLQLSSGTTGLKKAVALPHRAVLAQIDAYADTLALQRDDVIVSWLPLYHDMGLIACMILPMVAGLPVVAMDALQWVRRPSMFLDAIERHRGTLAWLPNFAFHHLAARSGGKTYDLGSLRAVINCSEPCKPEAFDRFLERFGAMGVTRDRLHCCYAMAETVFAVSQSGFCQAARVDQVDRDAFDGAQLARPAAAGAAARALLSSGRLLANTTLRVVGPDGAALAERQVGELVVASDCLFDGYVGQPEVTAERLRDGWYHTGDLGYLAEGELFVVGRQDDLIISNGRNYYAHDIEGVVSRLGGVIPGRCVALGVYNPESGSQDVVVLAESQDAGTPRADGVAETIRAAVMGEFGLALDAVRIRPPGDLIKTSSGKISRSENLRRHVESARPPG